MKNIFRGKVLGTNDWVKGNLLSYPDEELYLIEYKFNSLSIRKQVNEKSIGQFVGMHDRNGVEIWENDILKSFKDEDDFYLYGDMSIVNYCYGSYYLTLLYDMVAVELCNYDRVYNSNTDYPDKTYLDTWLKDFEVVGNYFDNSDILIKK